MLKRLRAVFSLQAALDNIWALTYRGQPLRWTKRGLRVVPRMSWRPLGKR